ncbi:MAG: DUF488 domain-containing protein [Anaerolineales bacterium]|nr:DUF488 domain-containing protein [Anaerolineales bacterium]
MKIYTIGFAQKSAQEFFEALRQHGVQQLIDIRLRPSGQLAGFARKDDLPYFLEHLAGGCQYVHLPDLAPTKEILTDYRAGGDWSRYVERFEALMDERNIPGALNQAEFESLDCCLLCSEPTPEQCHRRLVAERLAARWPNVEVIHL